MTLDEKKILKAAIDVYGNRSQTDMMIEEMSELTKALLKYRRAVRSHISGIELVYAQRAICEEIADVGIMLDQMRLIYCDGEDDYTEWRKYKIDRLAKRIAAGGGEE